MSSSTVPEPPVETTEAVQYSTPSERTKVRRRRSRHTSTVGRDIGMIALRIFVVLATAFAFLVLWQETAYAQAPVVTDPPVKGVESTPGRPSGIEEWVRQIKEQKEAASKKKVSPNPDSTLKTPPSDAPTQKPKPEDPLPTDPSTESDSAGSPAPDPSASGQSGPGSSSPGSGSSTSPPSSTSQTQSGTPSPVSRIDAPAVRLPSGPASTTNPKTAVALVGASSDQGTVAAGQLPTPKALSEIPDRELLWNSSLDLIMALEREFEFVDPPLVPETLESDLTSKLIELSANVGHSDNPHHNLEQLRRYLVDTLGYAAVERETPDVELLLPRFLMSQKRASPLCVAMIALALADHLNLYLALEPIEVAGLLGLRYRSGFHRYILVPSYLDRLYDDEEFVKAAHGGESPPTAKIRVLTRKAFWATVIGSAGASLAAEGKAARAEQLLRRSLNLNPEQALPRIALARLLRQKRQFAAAREELDRALSFAPDHIMARLARSEILAELELHREMEKDLEWLFHRRGHEKAGLRLIQTYLDRGLFGAAEREWKRLSTLTPSTLSAADRRALELEVGAAPWIARLKNSADDRDRFMAVDRLADYPTAATRTALVDTLSDSNHRLANYACQSLKKMTGMTLPPDAARWREALSRLENRP